MSVAVVQTGLGVSSKTSGTSLGLNPSVDPLAGNLCIVAFASDDAAGTFSIADDQGNTWREVYNILNPGNVRSILWASILTATITGSITVTHPTLTARAFTTAEFSGVASSTEDVESDGTGTGSTTSTGSVTPSENNELVIGVCGWEGPISDEDFTQPTGFTIINQWGTTGGGAASNITVIAGYEIQTTATARSYPKTLFNSRDYANIIATFKQATAAAPGPVFRRRDRGMDALLQFCRRPVWRREHGVWLPGRELWLPTPIGGLV